MLTEMSPSQSRVSANGRVGATAAVYTAAILGMPSCASNFFARNLRNFLFTVEYLTAEVLELAGNASKDLKASILFNLYFDAHHHTSYMTFHLAGQAYHPAPLAACHSW